MPQLLNASYDILALQEVVRQGGTPSCPRSCNYHLLFGGGRTAIYVHKRHPLHSWTSEISRDFCSVSFPALGATVYSIYSPNPTIRPWTTPLHTLAARPRPVGTTMLVGDFNLHHPLWDRFKRESTGATALLALAEAWELQLLTPWGEPTRSGHGQLDSTIDHAWVTAVDGRAQGVYEGPEEFVGSDHRPQVAVCGTPLPAASREPLQPAGFSWARMNPADVANTALHWIPPLDSPISTPEFLECAVKRLTDQLTAIANLCVPRRAAKAPHGGRADKRWTAAVDASSRAAKAARRRWFQHRTEETWAQFQRRAHEFKTSLRHSQRALWRQGLAEASTQPRKLWTLERWARLRSHMPPVAPKVPPLQVGTSGIAETHAQKAAAFADRFFPTVHPRGYKLPESARHSITMPMAVDEDDVAATLQKVRPWKAPGPDGFPAGFLKACGPPFCRNFAAIAAASLQLGHFPTAFKKALVVVIPKPGKTPQQLRVPGGWRPISLLSCMGKLLEAIVAKRITKAAETQGWLPDGQFGNRAGRSTETAGRFLTQVVRTAWTWKGTASFLQLDLKGAFDRVNHHVLLASLKGKGMPEPWLRWLDHYLRDRTSALLFDGLVTDYYSVTAGVPQGSPLSPILFILFVSSLYFQLRRSGLLVVGFADDTNLLAFGNSRAECVQTLEGAFQTAYEWATSRGMEFAPEKSELVHFCRGPPDRTPVRLNRDIIIKPVNNARFLGIWIDRRLSFAAHGRAVRAKMALQMNALTRLAASAWGISLARAREVYTKVVRSAIAYGAGVTHNPTQPTLAKAMAPLQNAALRKVLGAYKATPARQLEVETACPPLDVYFNKRLADFENRLAHSKVGRQISQSCAFVAQHLRNRRGRPRRPKPPPGSHGWRDWAAQWVRIHTIGLPATDQNSENAARLEWERRWADTPLSTTRAAADSPLRRAFQGSHLRLYEGLRKAQSSMLAQARTGKIGLRHFLFQMRVPGVTTPICPCGVGRHTVEHLFTECQDPRSAQLRSMDFSTSAGVHAGLSSFQGGTAATMALTLLRSGWFPEFRVAESLRREEALQQATEQGWTYKPPPQRAKRRAPARRPGL